MKMYVLQAVVNAGDHCATACKAVSGLALAAVRRWWCFPPAAALCSLGCEAEDGISLGRNVLVGRCFQGMCNKCL